MATSLGSVFGTTAGGGRFRAGAEIQYIATDPSKGYHIQYRYFIDVLKTATSDTYFTRSMTVSWSSTQYACGDKIARVGYSSWLDGGWVNYPNQFTVPSANCLYYYTSGMYKSELTGAKVSMPGALTFKVTFYANGGSGAPAAITGNVGSSVTIPSTTPTRSGYTFKGWSTTSTGSVAYKAGDKLTKATNLYAVWQQITYTVSYNANGGSGAPASQTKVHGTALTLSAARPTKENYEFLGWATTSTGSVVYQPGASYTANAAVTLYAIWKQKANGYAKFDTGWEPGMVYKKSADGWEIAEAMEKTSDGWKPVGL